MTPTPPPPEVATARRRGGSARQAGPEPAAPAAPPSDQTPAASWYRAVDTLRSADPGDVQEIAASQIEMLRGFYTEVIEESKQSFQLALYGSLLGLIFFVAAIAVLLLRAPQSGEVAVISAVAGGIVQVVSGLLFAMVRSARRQLARYYERLDQTQRYLLANSMCSGVPEPVRSAVRAELIRTIASCEQAAGPGPPRVVPPNPRRGAAATAARTAS